MHCLGAAFYVNVVAKPGGIYTGQANKGSESIRKSAGNPYLIHSEGGNLGRVGIGQHIRIFIRIA